MAIPRFALLFFLASMIWCGHYPNVSGSVSDSLSSTARQPNRYNRHLLQVSTPCQVNFQAQNYTIITSQCKGPDYPQKACCDSFIEFACPFASEINDNTTDCASTMFSYINIYGKYPAGLFANECVSNSSLGLPCPAGAPASPASNAPSSALFGLRSGSYTNLLCFALVTCTISLLFDASLVFDTR